MTRQTEAPIQYTNFEIKHERASSLARLADDGHLDLNPPYQRGSVWTLDQRIALVESWLRGISVGSVVLADRWNYRWHDADGKPFDPESGAMLACVDGQQRITTARMWFADEFAVPASWFPAEHVERTEDTDDGPYVRFSYLSRPGRNKMTLEASLQSETVKTATCIEDEARIYLLRNEGGTAQTAANLANAARIAEGA
ncbi:MULTISPECIES: DUF262 domain-containing protein [unclassified Streptomyces]|uniref:DUF262 domain-containing protein n=1 Tax=unclassified Streptomyces TaxID=2593676 RepID=UPI0035DBCBC4